MRAIAAVIPSTVPESVQILSLTQLVGAWGLCERSVRNILQEERVPLIQLGHRTHGVRVSDARKVLRRRERPRASAGREEDLITP